MAFDGLLLHVLTKELADALAGGRIDRVYQPQKELLILNIYNNRTNHRLLISTAADSARMHLTNGNFDNPQHPPMFCMMLRKHLEGGRISKIRQPQLERVAALEIEGRDQFGEPTTRTLLCELMGKHSNVILLNNQNTIMDSLKRFSAAVNQYREVTPGAYYIEPPRQDKVNPLTLSEEQFTRSLLEQELNQRVDKALLSILSGFSPQSCRELVQRAGQALSLRVEACGQYELSRLWQALAEILAEIRSGAAQATLVRDGQRYVSFSPFDLSGENEDQKEHFPTLNQALDIFFTAKREQQQFKELSYALRTKITKEIERLAKKQAIYQAKLEAAAEADLLRQYGELITANIYRMNKGEQKLLTENFYTGETVTIPLEPGLTPSENAQRYFKRYHKIKQGGQSAAKFLQQANSQFRYLDSVLQALDHAQNLTDLEDIRQELVGAAIITSAQARKGSGKQQKKPRSTPRQFVSEGGCLIMVGKNNRQNDEITLKTAKPEYWWFHVKEIPGSHVVLFDEHPSQTNIEDAAMLAAFFSKARDSANVPVDYTRVKHVKKPKGAKPGMVIYEHQNTLFVTPELSLIERLEQGS